MSAFTLSNNADWLQLKHHQRPSRFGLGCGARDSDWDYMDSLPPRCGYTFSSEERPIELLNNHGGMDDDEEDMVKNVWTPYQQMAAAAEEQIEPADTVVMESTPVSDGMDIDVEVDNTTTATDEFAQKFVSTSGPQMLSASNKNKRNFEDIELSTGMSSQCQPQGFQFDNKRVRLGA